MDLILSRLTQLEEQARLQASSVAQLKAANEAQLDLNALLSSENTSLKTRVKLLEKNFIEVSKAAGGTWLWEETEKDGSKEGGEEGVWVWSGVSISFLSSLLVSSPPQISSYRSPPTSLHLYAGKVPDLSSLRRFQTSRLPRLLSNRAPGHHRQRLPLVGPVGIMSGLVQVPRTHYPATIRDRSIRRRFSFVVLKFQGEFPNFPFLALRSAHSSSLRFLLQIDDGPRSKRVTDLLVPHRVFLDAYPDDMTSFHKSDAAPLPLSSLIHTDSVDIGGDGFSSSLVKWGGFLRYFNPRRLTLTYGEPVLPLMTFQHPPIIDRPLNTPTLDIITSQWSRLEVVRRYGSILLLPGDRGTTVFDECLKRRDPEGSKVESAVVTRLDRANGPTAVGFVQEGDLVDFLERDSYERQARACVVYLESFVTSDGFHEQGFL